MPKTRCLLPLSLIFTALVLAGCASSARFKDRYMFDVFRQKPEKIERIFDKTERQDLEPADRLLRLVDKPPAARDNLLAELERRVAGFEELIEHRDLAAKGGQAGAPTNAPPGGGARGLPAIGGLAGLGILEAFPADPDAQSGTSLATAACQATFCAGVAARSLNPEDFVPPLPDRPQSSFLRSLTGTSEPPLAGYFGRLRKNCLGLGLRLGNRKHYYAHMFKDHQPATSGPGIQVKALVLRAADGKTFYWAKADLIGAFQDLRSTVLKMLHDQNITDIGEENFLLHGTHTHSGLGALSPRWFAMIATVDLWDRTLYERVAGEIVEAIKDARAPLAPAKLGTGSVSVDHVTRNRRERCGADPANPAPDPTVGIIRIVKATDDSPLATILNFAIHGTSLGDGNKVLHPDNIGYIERYIEQAHGGAALFFNATQGDVGPVGHVSDIGCAVGCEVVDALPAIATTSAVALESTFCHLNDPPDPQFQPACSKKLEQIQFRPLMFLENPLQPGCFLNVGSADKVITFPKASDWTLMERQGAVFAAYRLDHTVNGVTTNTVVLGLPAEPITDIGTQIRAGTDPDFENVWIFGLSNAHMGYVVNPQEYAQGGYEAGATFFGPTQGDHFRDIAVGLANQIAP